MILRHDAGLEVDRREHAPAQPRACARSRDWPRSRAQTPSSSAAATGSSPSWSRAWPSGRWWASSARPGSASPRCCAPVCCRRSGPARCRAARAGARCCCDPESTRATSSGARSAGTFGTAGRRLGQDEPDRGRHRPARGAVHGLRGRGGAERVPRAARGRGERPRTSSARAVHAARRLLRPAERISRGSPSCSAAATRWWVRSIGDELKEAIEQPAVRAGLEVERAAGRRARRRGRRRAGALPLLSTTLLELWQARDRASAPAPGLPRDRRRPRGRRPDRRSGVHAAVGARPAHRSRPPAPARRCRGGRARAPPVPLAEIQRIDGARAGAGRADRCASADRRRRRGRAVARGAAARVAALPRLARRGSRRAPAARAPAGRGARMGAARARRGRPVPGRAARGRARVLRCACRAR